MFDKLSVQAAIIQALSFLLLLIQEGQLSLTDESMCMIVVVVVLLFYVHGKHLRPCRDQYFVHILLPVTDNCPS